MHIFTHCNQPTSDGMSATSAPQGSNSQLLDALKTNAEANRQGAEALAYLALDGPKLPSTSSDPQRPSLQLLEALKINAEANRVNAQALAHLALEAPKLSESSLSPQRTARLGSFVINERVGTITTAEWDALGNERVSHLAKVLRDMTDEFSPHDISWTEIGNIIQRRLSLFGFRFLSQDEVQVNRGWDIVAAKGNDKRAIVTAILDHNRVDIGWMWYTNEMLRVWSQLMEITDAWTAR
ncbi:hypothetical protein DFP73DRAFT_559601 [Morchella snyderi]|nr:hypothetical protein DFP73DRAFT_559601 [Morchella snyderi]